VMRPLKVTIADGMWNLCHHCSLQERRANNAKIDYA